LFTGIVEAVGVVARIERRAASALLVIEAPEIRAGVALGASIAVNGCCLTVADFAGAGFVFEAVAETLARTNLGALANGSRVNLERALRADGRFDGHIVQGHVDCVGRARALERKGDDVRLAVDCGADFAGELVPKGSVAVDGVSLTVAALCDAHFELALIPHTLAHTTLGAIAGGEAVNLEADVLGKYARRMLGRIRGEAREGSW
jgi:riboflavin synthase